ncbi:MAG: S49 family peptidase [Desulfarculus sp.]|nr:S49 family peptidase [Desulfarculus sp.]
MKYARIAAQVFNRPLLIEPSHLLPITSYLLGRMQGQAPEVTAGGRLAKLEERTQAPEEKASTLGVEMEVERPFKDWHGDITPEGIAVITVTGELVHRASWVDADSGLMSYEDIERRLDAAQADPRVRGILTVWASPGGEAAGCFILADKIYNSRAAKPTWALVDESACSAAYALACAASRVLLTEAGQVGSVGVIWQAMDMSRQDKALGLQYTVIQYGARKNDFNPHFPISPEALAWAQAETARLGEQFVALVARNRGISAEAVRGTEAGLLFGPAAVEAGLADAILEAPGPGQTLAAKAAALLAESMQSQSTGRLATPAVTRNHQPQKGAIVMADEDKQAAGTAQAQPASDQPAAQAPSLDAARAEGLKAGASAERARLAAILNHPEAKGREAVALGLALESDLDAEAAARVLAKASKQSPNPLAMAMAGIPEPGVGPDAPRGQAPAGALMTAVMANRLGITPGQKGA